MMEAQNIATRNQHQSVDVEHLMLALLEQEAGLVPRLFEPPRKTLSDHSPDILGGGKLSEGRRPQVIQRGKTSSERFRDTGADVQDAQTEN